MPPEESSEAGVVSERLQIGIAADPAEVRIAQPESPFERGERLIYHAELRVTACQVVPGDRAFASEPDELQVGLESPVMHPFGGEVIGMDLEHVGVERIAREHASEEADLEIELTLIAKTSG